jgi:hypothetical protein
MHSSRFPPMPSWADESYLGLMRARFTRVFTSGSALPLVILNRSKD